MLAAECAWAVLRAEHARIREWLALVDGALRTGRPTRPEQWAAALIDIIERLQEFERTTHRPKGVMLVELLRGKSAQADELLNQLALESRHCDSLLAHCKSMLKLVAAGDIGTIRAIETLLQEHRQLMHAHLEREDTLLHSQSAMLLTREEWATVVSSMSKAIVAGTIAAGRERGRPEASGNTAEGKP
jgi:hemerythrin-like domain-containing protein